MNARAALLALFAAAACGGKADAVELRLYPCAAPGGGSMSVELAIQSRDGDGAPVGALLTETFTIPAPAVFSDGYATVAFRPPAGTVTADFTVTWSGGGIEATATYVGVAVPALGEALVLGEDGCDEGPGSTSEPTGTSAPTTTDATTGEVTTTGTTEVGTSTTEGSTSTTTTGSTGTTTGETTSGSSGTTSGGPMEGQPCMQGEPIHCDGGPGVLGVFLKCSDGVWTKADPPCTLENVCPPELGLTDPQMVGCLGDGPNWTCACAETPVQECPMGGTSKCSLFPLGVKVELCVQEGDKLNHYVGSCGQCVEEVPGQPLCVP